MKIPQMANGKWQIVSRAHKGFTLIELLIVIVIIGILSTFVISNFVGIRERARDAQRKTDLRQIQTAMQLYYSDVGSYPSDATDELGSCGNDASLVNPDNTSGAVYMQRIPCDPQTDEPYTYIPAPGGCNSLNPGNLCFRYELSACLENAADGDTDENEGGTNKDECSSEDGLSSFTVLNP